MPTFNKYVQIEDKPSVVAAGMEKAITAAAAKDERIIAVLEDMGFPGVLWFKKNCPGPHDGVRHRRSRMGR